MKRKKQILVEEGDTSTLQRLDEAECLLAEVKDLLEVSIDKLLLVDASERKTLNQAITLLCIASKLMGDDR